MGHKFRFIFAFIIFLAIIFAPVPSSRGPQPVKKDPHSILRKKAAKMLIDISGLKLQKTPLTTQKIEQEEKEAGNRVMTSSLQKEINRYIEEDIRDIRIVLNTSDNSDELSEKIEAYGGRIIRKTPGFLAIEIPVDKVEDLIQENSSIGYARLPFRFFPAEKISEGVTLTGANIFHDTIYRGAGVKVAVVDGGFKGLTAAISAGELPSDVKTLDISGLGLQTEYYHGTACAEIIHDMAPDAELHLLKMGDEIDSYEAIDYCIDNNIDIVSLSLGTFGSGPGNGTGPVDEAFDELSNAGILVVASAGNYGNTSYKIGGGIVLTFGSHWEGTFNDMNDDTYHEFKSGHADTYYNVISAYPNWNDDGKPSKSEVSVLMRWDDWPVSNIDYDMYLYEYDFANQEIGDLVATSETYQTGTQPPVEYISMDVPDSAVDGLFYALKVKKNTTDTPLMVKMEIYLGGTSEFVPFDITYNGSSNWSAIAHSTSSISEPADAESVVAVGAIDYTSWTTGPQEDFSSQGPTNNWNGSVARTKPDVAGPDGVTTYTYGDSSFFGTSAAAPHVAGLAALTLSANPHLTPDELQSRIEENAIDMGDNGRDNQYGWGRVGAFLPYSPIVKSYQKINNTEGYINGTIPIGAEFGKSIASIGDLNGDGIGDLAVGMSRYPPILSNCIYIYYL